MITAKTIKPTARNMMSTVLEIIDFLQSKELFNTIQIYVNDKRITSERLNPHQTQCRTRNNTTYYIDEDDFDMTEYIEYSDPRYIAMTFEGPLYDMINYIDFDFVYDLSKKFLEKYNLYFDMPDAISLAAYQI